MMNLHNAAVGWFSVSDSGSYSELEDFTDHDAISLNKCFCEPRDRVSLSKRSGMNLDDQDTNTSSDYPENDLISQVLGDFGRWQLGISILMSLLKLSNAWYQLNVIFMAPAQTFYCEKPSSFHLYSDAEWRVKSQPWVEEEPCLIFDPDLLLGAKTMDRSKIPLVKCKHFVFEKSLFTRTILSDWNLVCDRRWMMHASQVVAMFGILVGALAFGMIADSHGRKSPLMWCIVGQAASSFFISAVTDYWWFLGARFVQALFSGGVSIISFVLCLEAVSGKWRMIIPVIYQIPFGLGITVMSILSNYFRDWRKVEFSLATLSSLYILYWFYITESPRWLLADGKTDEAVEVLYEAALKNGSVEWSRAKIKTLIKPRQSSKRPEPPPFLSFVKNKNMRLKTIMLSLNWLFTGIAFYTFSQYLGSIVDNIFVSVAVTGLLSLPGPMICVYFVLKYNRKTTIWIFQCITGLSFISIILIPRDYEWTRVNFAGFGYAAMSAYVPTLYLYSGELYPTLGRNRGVALVTMFARFGSMLGTFFSALDNLMPDLTLMVIAGVSFTQLLLLIPLPETKGRPLPDTLEECEQFQKDRIYKPNVKKYIYPYS